MSHRTTARRGRVRRHSAGRRDEWIAVGVFDQLALAVALIAAKLVDWRDRQSLDASPTR